MGSKTFCSLPWKHLATHPHGAVTLCCESDHTNRISESFDSGDFKREFKTLHTTEYDFDAIQNSDSFSTVRKQMLAGEEPAPCTRCFDFERVGIKSKRQLDNERLNFTEEEAIRVTNADGSINSVDYEFIELRLGNICNVACRTCNPFSTSRWVKDWNEVNPENPQTIDQNMFNWPTDQNFWDKLIQHCDSLRIVYINGGEPLLIDKHMSFLQDLIDRDVAKNITLVYSTNCTIVNHEYEEIWKKFKHVQLMLSIDALGAHNHFIRHPTKWAKVLETISWVKDLSEFDNISYNIMCTVSIYNIWYLKEFHEFFKEVPYISLNFVTDPAYQDASRLPEAIKLAVLKKYAGCSFYDTIEQYLGQKESVNDLTEFMQKTLKMDELRKNNFSQTFPELYKLLTPYVR